MAILDWDISKMFKNGRHSKLRSERAHQAEVPVAPKTLKKNQLVECSGKNWKVGWCQILRALEERVRSSGSILSGIEKDWKIWGGRWEQA